MRQQDGLDWPHHGAPISQVLNEADSSQLPVETHFQSSAPAFSGKLIDLLLDTSADTTNERRRVSDHVEDVARLQENTVITLPQPAQPQARTARRPRIPPLLQGLHQPPPLPPNGRLFPPITDGVSGFEREIRHRIQSGNDTQNTQSRNEEDIGFTGNGEPNNPQRARGSQIRHEQSSKSSTAPLVSTEGRRKSSESKTTDAVPKATESSVKKRKKWSEEETRDLLLGVSRFGIGNWKKILLCPDFKFAGRTAVDLKDKFRVCCPDDTIKPKRIKRRKEADRESARSSGSIPRSTERPEVPSTEATRSSSSTTEKPLAEGAGDVHNLDETELAKLGIQTPFAKSTRRPRHMFSVVDDDNLLQGFQRHGVAWLSIRDDKDLGFETRRPTDLRDRFRIRYPEAYAKAGLKGKVKPLPKGAEVEKENQARQEIQPDTGPSSSQSNEMRTSRGLHPRAPDHNAEERSIQRSSAMRPPAHPSSYPDLTHAFLDEHSADEDGNSSPIVLNRNILQWADANTVSISSSNAPHYTNNYVPRDTHTINTATVPHDGLHINPMATLKLPMLTLSDHTSFSHSPDPSTLPWSSFSRPPADNNPLLRTPNLPTIVFPHVPAISARTMVHNLPTPADLLSGMDLEGGDGGMGVEHGGGGGGGAHDYVDLR